MVCPSECVAGPRDAHAGLSLPVAHNGWPPLRMAAFSNLSYFTFPLSGGVSCLRAHYDGSHSPICLPWEAEHSTGWVRAGNAGAAGGTGRGLGMLEGRRFRVAVCAMGS